MSKSGACRAFWLISITLELSLSAYHTCDPFRFGRSDIFSGGIGAILVLRANRILRFRLRLPRKIVEVAVIVVNRVEAHIPI